MIEEKEKEQEQLELKKMMHTVQNREYVGPQKLAEDLASLLTGHVYIDPTDARARALREEGKDYPDKGLTMIGLKRLENVFQLLRQITIDGIEGDVMECGVWRGGTLIFMRLVLDHLGQEKRRVIGADSFNGMPPEARRACAYDQGVVFGPDDYLRVPIEEVRENLQKWGAVTNVELIKGWFEDTLPDRVLVERPKRKLALLRLDGDLYQSTMTCLIRLYRLVPLGGFIVIDDYVLPTCRQAVSEFREYMGITDEIHPVDYTGVWWRKGVKK